MIRPVTPEDAPELARLCGQLGYPTPVEQIVVRLAAIMPLRDHAIWVDAEGPALRGWIHVHRVLRLESAEFAELGGLVVDEAARGQGVGKALVAQAEAWTAAEGVARVRVRSNVIREDAHRFYLRLGYRKAKAQQVFEKDLPAS